MKTVSCGAIDGLKFYLLPDFNRAIEAGIGKVCQLLKGRTLLLLPVIVLLGKVACQYGTTYASVMGLGKAEVLETPEEKIDGLVKFMKTQTGKDFAFDEKMVSIVSVIKITAKDFTAKKRPLPMGIK